MLATEFNSTVIRIEWLFYFSICNRMHRWCVAPNEQDECNCKCKTRCEMHLNDNVSLWTAFACCWHRRSKNSTRMIWRCYWNIRGDKNMHTQYCRNYGWLFDFSIGSSSVRKINIVTRSMEMWLKLFLPHFYPSSDTQSRINCNDEHGKNAHSSPELSENEIFSSFDLIWPCRLCGGHSFAFGCESNGLRRPQNMSENTESHLMNNVSIIISCPDNELIPSAECVCHRVGSHFCLLSLFPSIRQFSKPKIHYSGLDISNCYQFR